MGIVSAMMQVGAAIKHAVAALFKVTHSLRFDGSGDSLTRSQTAPTATTKWTWSGWVKKLKHDSTTAGEMALLSGGDGAATQSFISFLTDRFGIRAWNTSSNIPDAYTSLKFTDSKAWNHFVVAYDSTINTPPSDRVKIWVNGQPESLVGFAGGAAAYPSHNQAVSLNDGTEDHFIGRRYSNSYWFDGQLAEVHFIDGQALTASDFGETRNGQWVPKEVTGVTYGNNGFYLPFSTPSSDVNAFNAVTYVGNNQNNISVTGVGFSPDLVWIKDRDFGSSHALFDTVRGTQQRLRSDTTGAEETQDGVTSFDTDGFTVGTNLGVNRGTNDYITWAWKAGGAPTATNNTSNGTGQTPTSGSVMIDGVASTAQLPSASIYPKKMSVNTDAGFSIVQYGGTGLTATIPHGLSSAPDVIIIKDTTDGTRTTDQWPVYHSATGATGDLVYLHQSSAGIPASTVWVANPTSDVFTVGSWSGINHSNDDFIAYCWRSVPGFSKFGSYSGSGGAGNKVTTGFKPAFVMIKSTGSNNWVMIDNKRSPTNPADEILYADSNAVEATGGTTTSVNFLADGFDFGGGGGSINSTGSHTYIYMAFADTSPNLGRDATTDGKGVTLLLDGSGGGGATVPDSSSVNNTVNNNGVDNPASNVTGPYGSQTQNVFEFDGTDDYLTLSNNSAPQLGKGDFTFECWLKLNNTTGTKAIFDCRVQSNDTKGWVLYLNGTSLIHSQNSGFNLTATSAVTSSKWHHVALVRASNTTTLFVDGVSKGTVDVTDESYDFKNPLTIGAVSYGGSSVGDFAGNMADIRITQGVARDIAAGFSNGTPISGGGWDVALTNDDTWDKPQNNFTVNGNITPDDQLIDTPNLRFAALNPNSPSTGTFSNGNLSVTTANSGAQDFGNTALPSSGKVYWEVYVGAAGTSSVIRFIYIGDGAPSGTPVVMYRSDNGDARIDGSYTTYGDPYTEGHVIGVAVDLDNGKVEFFRDGTGQGLITYDFSAETVYPAVSDGDGNNGAEYTFNFGQDHTFAGSKSPLTSPHTDDDGNGEFYYQPPSGFKALAESY